MALVNLHRFQREYEAFRVYRIAATVLPSDRTESAAQNIFLSQEQNKQRAFVVAQFVELLSSKAVTSASKEKLSGYLFADGLRDVSG